MGKCEYYFYQSGDRCRIKERLRGESTDKVGSDTYKNFCNYTDGHKKCPFYEALMKEKNSGCFLTSACVEARGLPDDCTELNTLRNFRDGWLMSQSFGKRDVEEYYRIAPKIVEEINRSKNAKGIFEEIYNRMVTPCMELINDGKFEETYRLYRNMTEEFKQRFLFDNYN